MLIKDSVLDANLLTNQQKTDVNNEVVRLNNYLKLFQFCWEREENGQPFSPDMIKVIYQTS